MRLKRYILSLAVPLLAGCAGEALRPETPQPAGSAPGPGISALCVVDVPADGNSPAARNRSASAPAATAVQRPSYAASTKSMMDIWTTRSLQAQFLRIDEDIDTGTEGAPGLYTWTGGQDGVSCSINWPEAYLINASIVSAAADSSDYYLRNVYFDPSQSYKMRMEVNDDKTVDTLQFYHTRMIGWYPRNYGSFMSGSSMQLESADGSFETDAATGRTALLFDGLSLDTDLMISDVREAQHWHEEIASDSRNGAGGYAQPYGYNEGSPSYCNYFTFKHYRSAVRVFAVAEQGEQNLEMWGSVDSLTIVSQPTACKVWLPDDKDQWPTEVEWSGYKDRSLITTPMFGDDDSHEGLGQSADWAAIDLAGATKSDPVYLGYAMVEPERDVEFDLHMTSGVYRVTVPAEYTDSEGNAATRFEASKYYTVTLVLNPTGISAIMRTEGEEHYYDLTARATLSDGSQGFRFANCYIIDPDSDEIAEALAALNATLDEDEQVSRFSGYAFSATRIGNGAADNTLYPYSTAISPVSAKLVWESSGDLITNVEVAHSYVRFLLPEDKEGNAVIAVYDDAGNVIWSWHIWITDTPGEVTAGGHTFLDRNLGATAAEAGTDPLQTYGLYYQWGRKDPSPGPESYNYPISCLNTASYYDFSEEELTAAEVKFIKSPTVEDGIRYPMYLILPQGNQTGAYTFDWLGTPESSLWGYDTTTGEVSKTIYDPCPYGYRVPGTELSEAVSSAIRSVGTYGHTYDGTLFLPYAGYKGDDRGSSSVTLAWGTYYANTSYSTEYCSLGSLGDYQSSVISTSADDYRNHRGRTFISSSNIWYFWIGDAGRTYSGYLVNDYTSRRTAAPVRCVKDE